jgi:hypothetical protein
MSTGFSLTMEWNLGKAWWVWSLYTAFQTYLTLHFSHLHSHHDDLLRLNIPEWLFTLPLVPTWSPQSYRDRNKGIRSSRASSNSAGSCPIWAMWGGPKSKQPQGDLPSWKRTHKPIHIAKELDHKLVLSPLLPEHWGLERKPPTLQILLPRNNSLQRLLSPGDLDKSHQWVPRLSLTG